MVVNEQKMTDILGKDIFTDKGSYCGKIADLELELGRFKVRAIVVDAAKGSYLSNVVGGKRGVIVPYAMIKAVDDVAIVKHITAQATEEE